jgi:Holliday junction DNA helicase RuvA
MIGRIKGQLIEKKSDSVIIDVHGIGYVVYVTEKTARSLNLDNQAGDISLYSELLVKEDLLQLVGFITQTEKDWFNILRSVQGIGAKVALTILNTLDTKELLRAVRMKNELAFSSVSGIGSRMAQRLVVELSGRKDLTALEDEEIKEIKDQSNEETVNIIKRKEIQQDALSALQNLGFKAAEAKSTIDKILVEDDFRDASQLVKKALRSLAKG